MGLNRLEKKGGKVMKLYDTFHDEPEKIPQMKEIELLIRDLSPGKRKYCCMKVKAIVSKDPDALPDGDELLIRSQRGILFPEKWKIKILEQLEDYKISE
jgi:hypothetical protein